jgi:hypothetical protein
MWNAPRAGDPVEAFRADARMRPLWGARLPIWGTAITLTRVFFQRVLKGVHAATPAQPDGLTDSEIETILAGGGLLCNWWRNKPDGAITPREIQDKLSDTTLRDHLVDYERVADETPYLSTTAGVVERDTARARNVYFPPLYTALRFATANFSRDGYVFHAYVFALGKKAVELQEFAEELRDLQTYTRYYAYHPEGEFVEKIELPATRIEKVERYNLATILSALAHLRSPSPDQTFRNEDVYRDPKQYANIRGFPELAV